MPDNKQTISIVVNGTPVSVEANVNAPLRTVIQKALDEGGVVGQPSENWELRDGDGHLLDLAQKIGGYGFTATTTLFLSLQAGVAG